MRDPEEVAAWPFPGSVHIPLEEVLRGELTGLPRDREIIATCAHGNRSATAAAFLVQRGMRTRSLRGGIAAWSQVYDLASIPMGQAAEILQVRRLGKGCISYVVVAGGRAAVIDPSRHVDQYVKAAATRSATIAHVVDTHLHADHLSGARQMAHNTGATLHLNPAEGFAFGGFDAVTDGSVLRVGDVPLTALAAPGHTAGGLVWNIGGRALATGDVLFLESIGRPDLHGEAQTFARDLYRTLTRIAAMDGDLAVLPGHMPESTLLRFGMPHTEQLGAVAAKLKLGAEGETAFVKRVRHVPERPPNAEEILEVNRTGRAVATDEADTLEEGPNRCAAG